MLQVSLHVLVDCVHILLGAALDAVTDVVLASYRGPHWTRLIRLIDLVAPNNYPVRRSVLGVQIKRSKDLKTALLKALGSWPAEGAAGAGGTAITSLTTQVRETLVKTKVLHHIEQAFLSRSAALAAGRPVVVGRQLTADERSAPIIAQFARPIAKVVAASPSGAADPSGTSAEPSLLQLTITSALFRNSDYCRSFRST